MPPRDLPQEGTVADEGSRLVETIDGDLPRTGSEADAGGGIAHERAQPRRQLQGVAR